MEKGFFMRMGAEEKRLFPAWSGGKKSTRDISVRACVRASAPPAFWRRFITLFDPNGISTRTMDLVVVCACAWAWACAWVAAFCLSLSLLFANDGDEDVERERGSREEMA